MKRTAIILGIAAALAVPSVASAGNIAAQVSAQRIGTQVHTKQIHSKQVHSKMVFTKQVANTQRISAAITAQRMTPLRKSLR